MSRDSLSPLSYVVLGIVAWRGPTTSYEMKKFVARSIGFFWSFPHVQLYREPTRLARRGLVAEDQEVTGRRRRTYRITPTGADALLEWLAAPTGVHVEIRDVALVKLFFADLVDSTTVVSLAEAQIEAHGQLRQRYQGLLERYEDRAEFAHQIQPLRIGIAYENAYLSFWDSIRSLPPGGPGRPPRPVATDAESASRTTPGPTAKKQRRRSS